jgi:hypothetical protein
MHAHHPNSSAAKATTPSAHLASAPARRLMAIGIVGTALVDYQIQKTPHARIRLETVTTMAHQLGDLTASDAAVVARLLARPVGSTARARAQENGQ